MPRRPYARTGLNALKARVKVRGLHAIDQRTASARSLLSWRADLLRDLGGEENLSAQELGLVDMAARTRLYVDHLDAYLMEQPSLVLSRRRVVLPVLRERQQLVDSYARLLQALGLSRRAKPIPTLAAHLAAKGATPPSPDSGSQRSFAVPNHITGPGQGEESSDGGIVAPGGEQEGGAS